MLSFTMQAQDTIFSRGPKDNYLVTYDWWWKANTIWDYGHSMLSCCKADMARYFYTKDTLRVYGIAAAMISSDYFSRAIGTYPESVYMPLDTTHDLTESLRLYEYDATHNTLHQIGEDLPVNIQNTPISYYQHMTQSMENDTFDLPAFPVYERYFEHPQVVVDSFYAGVTMRNTGEVMTSEGPVGETWTVYPVHLGSSITRIPIVREAWQQWDHDDSLVWVFVNTIGADDWFLFPILTPNPDDITGHGGGGIDTTGVDTTRRGDTQGVERHDMMERMVAVTPNPAKTQVKVACGMGLTLVEVFDASGKQVLSEKASGMVHRLDVAGWPQGVYAVVVHTPLGKVTKKLLVE